MKKFIKSLLSSAPDNISSKRFRSILFSLVLISLAYLSAFSHTVSEPFVYIIAGLITNDSILSVIDKFRK